MTTLQNMTERQFILRISRILVYGHLALFCYGLVLVVFIPTRLRYIDIFQVSLMGFPMLAATALAAFDNAIKKMTDLKKGKKVDPGAAQMIQVICFGAIIISFFVYTLPALEVRGMNKDVVKIIIGVVESFLGLYLGKIRDHLFPPQSTSKTQ